MEKKIQKNEMLYRAIKRSKPDWLESGKPTSAMFKDQKGNSVDRDAQRKLDDIINFMNEGVFKNRLKGIVELNAGECMDEPINAVVKAAPTEANPYHANIFIADDEQKGSLQALMLADISRVVHINEAVNWVYL